MVEINLWFGLSKINGFIEDRKCWKSPGYWPLVKPDEHVSSNIFEPNAVGISGPVSLTEMLALLVYLSHSRTQPSHSEL